MKVVLRSGMFYWVTSLKKSKVFSIDFNIMAAFVRHNLAIARK